MAKIDSFAGKRRLGQISEQSSREIATGTHANEFVFGVVGHVGSGTTAVTNELATILRDFEQGGEYETYILKASEAIESWARDAGYDIPDAESYTIARATFYQDMGDSLRKNEGGKPDHAAVARRLIAEIRKTRAKASGQALEGPVEPDGHPRAYILDSIRHPAEVELLRHVYGPSFVLVGVVCEESVRKSRLVTKFHDGGEKKVSDFMKRDARAKEKNGQRVSDAFHLSDFFVDNTAARTDEDETGSEDWNLVDDLSRLKSIVAGGAIVRPTPSEVGMHAAHGAAMRSACLSRQVGAALCDESGSVVATGSNEVPRPGGGVYGDLESTAANPSRDHRCAHDPKLKGCSNTRSQTKIIDDIIEHLPESVRNIVTNEVLRDALEETRVRDLLEFSRAVHAEMAALMDAGRRGVSTVGTRVFVTTFPCHYCARHLVCAGVNEVQYIEPYPKSLALELHRDAIRTERKAPESDRRVLFRPFSGVAPRMFARAFLKDRELKNKSTGDLEIQRPEWASPWYMGRVSYAALEDRLAADV